MANDELSTSIVVVAGGVVIPCGGERVDDMASRRMAAQPLRARSREAMPRECERRLESHRFCLTALRLSGLAVIPPSLGGTCSPVAEGQLGGEWAY